MKSAILTVLIVAVLAFGAWLGLGRLDAKWSGVDETVVEKFAEKAGRPARKPFINTDQGDLLLFVFLLAGTGGGFVGGYFFRDLFPPKSREKGT